MKTQELQAVKWRPILMQAAMVRATLNDTKTETRRIVKPQPAFVQSLSDGRFETSPDGGFDQGVDYITCPYGKRWDRLWVKETFSPDATSMYPCPKVWYRANDEIELPATHTCPGPHPKTIPWADCLACWEEQNGKFKWRPSIFMPRWASRVALEIVAVRVERLQEISEADAIAEGIKRLSKDNGRTWKYGIPAPDGLPATSEEAKGGAWEWHRWRQSPVDAYEALWESINGPGSWDANPWVWVITFRRICATAGAAAAREPDNLCRTDTPLNSGKMM